MIEISGISKTYVSGRGKVTALENISFRVARGKLFVIAGKSGSGKTTLLNCIGGLEKPDCGRITCAGTNLGTLSATAVSHFQRKHVGFVVRTLCTMSHLLVRCAGFVRKFVRITSTAAGAPSRRAASPSVVG